MLKKLQYVNLSGNKFKTYPTVVIGANCFLIGLPTDCLTSPSSSSFDMRGDPYYYYWVVMRAA